MTALHIFVCLLVNLAITCSLEQQISIANEVRAFSLKEVLLSSIPTLTKTRPTPKLIESARDSALQHYHRIQPANHAHSHEGVFYLHMQNKQELEEILMDISNPSSPRYGQYLSRQSIIDRSVNPDSERHIIKYLEMHDFEVQTPVSGSGIIVAKAPIHAWQSLLNTQFHEFGLQDSVDDLRVVRAQSYSLPTELVDHVAYVFNIVSFPLPSEISRAVAPKRTAAPKADLSPQGGRLVHGYVTPGLLTSYYDIRNTTGNRLASQGVYETIEQTFSPTDLTRFQTYFKLRKQPVDTVIGGHAKNNACVKDNGNNCVEANLDVQYLMAVGENVPTTYFYWGGKDFILDWITTVSHMAKPPLVFSISYGADEAYITTSYGNAFDDIALKLGLMGVTLVASSGDDGAISSSARTNPLRCGYAPSFPASSPYVVAVGGTKGPESGTEEVGCQGDKGGVITSGGGFSTLYRAPIWQRSFTQAYLNSVAGTAKDPFKGYTASGRGIPDISFVAYNYIIAVNNNFTAVSGTSASSPVFAGMLSLVNSERLSRGLPAVGWILPALYTYYDHYVRDVVSGDNHCAASGLVCCSQGFSATQGWDPVTGLGSLNFTRFLDTMINIASVVPSASPTYLPGSPTPFPTVKPSPEPSLRPTRAPTTARGYLRIKQYSGTNCGGEVNTVSGAATDTCLIEYDSSGNVQGALKYTCEDGKATLAVYSDTVCKNSNLVNTQDFAYGCAYKVATDYYGTSFFSMEVDCIAGVDSQSLLTDLSGHYAVQISYGSLTGCDSGKESSALGVLQDHCFDNSEQEMSYKVHYPKVNYYRHQGCKGKVAQSETLSTSCEAAQDYGSSSGRKLTSKKSVRAQMNDEKVLEAVRSSFARKQLAQPESFEAYSLSTDSGSSGSDSGYAYSSSSDGESSSNYDGEAYYQSSSMSSSSLSSSIDSSSENSIDSSGSSRKLFPKDSGVFPQYTNDVDADADADVSSLEEVNLLSSSSSSSSSSASSSEQGNVDLYSIWSDKRVTATSRHPSLAPSRPPITPTQVPTWAPSPTPSTLPTAAVRATDTPSTNQAPEGSPQPASDTTRQPSQASTPAASNDIDPRATYTPTLMPVAQLNTEVPTALPVSSQAPTTASSNLPLGTPIVVAASQVFQGLTAAAWTRDSANCQLVFKTSVADVISFGVTPANVAIINVQDVSSASKAAIKVTALDSTTSEGFGSHVNRRQEIRFLGLAAGKATNIGSVRKLAETAMSTTSPKPQAAVVGLNVTYIITTSAATMGASSTNTALATLLHDLNAAVSDGSFDHSLHYHAAVNEVSALLTVETVAFSAHAADSNANNNDNDKDNSGDSTQDNGDADASTQRASSASTTLIVALVILLVVFVVGAVVFFVIHRAKVAKDNSSHDGSNNNSTGGRKKGATYIQLPLSGESMHGLRDHEAGRSGMDDEDIEVVEFHRYDNNSSDMDQKRSVNLGGPRATRSSPNSASQQSHQRLAEVQNPVFTQARMIQHEDDHDPRL